MTADVAEDTVTRIAWQRYRVPFRAAFRAAHGSIDAREGLIVEVELASGAVGIGEAAPLQSFAGGTVNETANVVEVLAAAMAGRPLSRCWPAPSRALGSSVAEGAVAAARCALETAVADLAARQDSLPLRSWLAARAMLPAPRGLDRVPVNAVIDLDAAGGLEAAVAAARREGFPAVKLKVGGDPLADARRVEEARKAGGDALEIRVDANCAWSRADADAFFAAVGGLGVALCEEPLRRGEDHFGALASLRRETAIPVGLDESCTSPDALADAIDARAASVVVVKPMVTGLSAALGMLMLVRKHGLRAIVTTTFDTGVGTALAVQLASLLPSPVPACGLATLDHLEHPLVADPPLVDRGAMLLPASPGLGVALDRDALARYAAGPRGEVRA